MQVFAVLGWNGVSLVFRANPKYNIANHFSPIHRSLMARRRHLSRIAVMQMLFEREQRPSLEPVVAMQRNASELGDFDEEFAMKLIDGIIEKEEEVALSIAAHAPGWTLDRMDPVSRCVLYVGAYELLFGGDAPPAVVINEAIEMAKEYGTDESGKFVNGVLNAMVKKEGSESGSGSV